MGNGLGHVAYSACFNSCYYSFLEKKKEKLKVSKQV